MTSALRPSRVRSDAGQVTAMLVLFSVCLLLAIIAVTDVSASYLRRQAATSLADGAALAATEAAAAAGVYNSTPDGFLIIDAQAAQAAVEQYLRATGAYGRYPGLRADVDVTGYTVHVALSMPFRLPITVPGVDATIVVHGTGSSVMPIY